jgi:hypothetical protein
VNPFNLHPSGENLFFFFVNVYAAKPHALPYVEAFTNGTHNSNNSNHMVIALCPVAPILPTPGVELDEKLKKMELKFQSMLSLAGIGSSKKPPSLTAKDDQDHSDSSTGFDIINTDVTGTIQPYGGTPMDVNLELVSNQLLPVDTFVIDPVPPKPGTETDPKKSDSDDDEFVPIHQSPYDEHDHSDSCTCYQCYKRFQHFVTSQGKHK